MSTFGYETAKYNVDKFLSAHLELITGAFGTKRFDKNLTTVLSDVNGTLLGSPADKELDQFLCDWHDAGLPVAIMTGQPDQALPFEITNRLKGSERQWFYTKPFSAEDIRAGIAFDDDERLARLAGFKGVDPKSSEGIDFLKSWAQLTPEDKAAQLKPFVDFHHHAYPSMSIETWTDPAVEQHFEKMAYLFDVDPVALIELKWTVEGLQPRVYEEYIPVLKQCGLINQDETVPDVVEALIQECLYEENGAWGLQPPEPGIVVMHMNRDEPRGGTTNE